MRLAIPILLLTCGFALAQTKSTLHGPLYHPHAIIQTAVNVSGTEIDPSTGSVFSKALTADTTFTFANLADGQRWSVILTNGASWTVTWPTADWPGEPGRTQPTMDTGAGVVSVFQFMRQGGVTIGGVIQQPAASSSEASIGITIDGGGSAITTGIKGDIYVPYACTINSVTLLADQSGSAVVDIWKDTYANYPPTDADSITASAVPTISAAIKGQDTTLTGWTTSISAGDTIRFNVDSAVTITRLTLVLKVTK